MLLAQNTPSVSCLCWPVTPRAAQGCSSQTLPSTVVTSTHLYYPHPPVCWVQSHDLYPSQSCERRCHCCGPGAATPWWVCMCFLTPGTSGQRRAHAMHWKGFSPVWLRKTRLASTPTCRTVTSPSSETTREVFGRASGGCGPLSGDCEDEPSY